MVGRPAGPEVQIVEQVDGTNSRNMYLMAARQYMSQTFMSQTSWTRTTTTTSERCGPRISDWAGCMLLVPLNPMNEHVVNMFCWVWKQQWLAAEQRYLGSVARFPGIQFTPVEVPGESVENHIWADSKVVSCVCEKVQDIFRNCVDLLAKAIECLGGCSRLVE